MATEDTSALVIRPAIASDAKAIAALAARLSDFPVPAWRTAEEIATADARAMMGSIGAGKEHDEVLLAARDGVPVGCLHMLAGTDFFGRRHAHISVIAVAEAAEGTGVGRALLAYAEGWARRRALPLLTLNVFAANARARRFYENGGFAPEVVKYLKPVAGEAT